MPAPSIPDPASIRRVAVRLTNWVGDSVMNTPFLARARAHFPNAEIVALGRKNVAAVLEHHPHVDEVWPIDDRSGAGKRDVQQKLRRFSPDLGFVLPNSFGSALLMRRGGVKCLVGYNRDGRRLLLGLPVPLRPEDLAVHEVRYYLRLLHFWESGPQDPPPLLLRVSEEEKEEMRQWLAAEGIGENDFVLGVNPAAFYGTAKRWLPERYAEVARQFARERGARCVVTGLAQEKDVADQVCRAGGEGFVNAAGRMTLRQLMAFLARCDLFLTNDSGAMHLAAALGTPLVSVFGSTDWVTTAPLSPVARMVRVDTPCAPCLLRHCPIDHRCMTGVSAEMVAQAARDLLSETKSEDSEARKGAE